MIHSEEFPLAGISPFDVFKTLSLSKDGSILLEFEEKAFIGLKPIKRSTPASFEELRRFVQTSQGKCSLAGFISYDAIRLIERIPNRHLSDSFPPLFFQSYETEIHFDLCNQIITFSTERKDVDFKKLLDEIIPSPASNRKVSSQPQDFQVDCSDENFCKRVLQAKEYISQGDAIQIVISRCFRKAVSATPLEIYEALRKVTSAPFLFFLETEDFAFAGASPERLVSSNDGIVETMPIAGTRPRGEGEEDLRLERELLHDEKELAEHRMLVDLGRNDLGKVCLPKSIQVKELMKLRRYSHVMHLVSKVEGKLKKEYDILDLLQAVFPAGTLSGAPKIRAMEIIDQLESSQRGLYGGAICLINPQGDLDSAIAIRTVFIKEGIATVRTGAGIVFDSDPMKEAEETRHKARAVLSAIALAEEAV